GPRVRFGSAEVLEDPRAELDELLRREELRLAHGGCRSRFVSRVGFACAPLCFTSDTRFESSPRPSIAIRTRSPVFAVYGSGGTSDVPVSSHAPTGSVYDEWSTAARSPGSRVMSATVAVPSKTEMPPRSIVMWIFAREMSSSH